jgi:hypothetical protein
VSNLGPQDESDADDRAAAFHFVARRSVRGCAWVILGVVLVAILAWLALVIYANVVYDRHPN